MARKVTALTPWFGSNRMLAKHAGELLTGCRFVAIPFAGGMSELLHIGARTILVGDLHRHVINLANVLRDDRAGPALIRRLRRTPFHEAAHRMARTICRDVEAGEGQVPPVQWAQAYFMAAWMGRNGVAGTGGEFRASFSVRYDGNGGDSATRFRSATEALRDWRKVMPRCTFVVRDCFELLADVKDEEGTGIYADPPWPDDGDSYRHKFDGGQQRRLAATLAAYTRARVVVRYGDHPLVRELYPAPHWRWVELTGRTAANKGKAEVLLVNDAA